MTPTPEAAHTMLAWSGYTRTTPHFGSPIITPVTSVNNYPFSFVSQMCSRIADLCIQKTANYSGKETFFS